MRCKYPDTRSLTLAFGTHWHQKPAKYVGPFTYLPHATASPTVFATIENQDPPGTKYCAVKIIMSGYLHPSIHTNPSLGTGIIRARLLACEPRRGN